MFAPVTVYTLNAAIAHVRSCDTETTLTVAANPEIAPVLDEFVERGGGAPERGSDVCAEIIVESVEPENIAEADADVWIPETSLRLEIPEHGLADQWQILQVSTASSPVGIALPAGEDPDSVDPDAVNVALDDPRDDPASLMWMVIFGVDQATVDGAEDPGAHPVMSAHEVERHNAETGDDLQIPTGSAQVAQFEYPMLVASDIDDARREAAYNLLRSYGLDEYRELMTEAGFQYFVPEPPGRSDTLVESTLAAWDSFSEGR
ncbi:hypothetical protein GCM10027447_04900 [Glycomyces halotolerans]